jgi:hypothetical protein
MKFVLTVNCDNAAFCLDEGEATTETAAHELAQILRKAAEQIENGIPYDYFQTIRDTNGNDVGAYAFKNNAYFEKG